MMPYSVIKCLISGDRTQANVQIQQDRIIGHLKAFAMKVMFGKADRVIAELVGELTLA